MKELARYDKQLAQLARSLERYGIPQNVSELVAAGIASRLLHWCWANLTDIIGDDSAVDRVASCAALPPGVIARLAYRAALLCYGVGKGTVYYLPNAFTERPYWLGEQWRKYRPKSFARAKNRAKAAKTEHPYDITESNGPDDDPLFGDPVEVPAKQKGGGDIILGFSQIIEYFTRRWQDSVGGGSKYPFGGAMDGQCIKRILAGTNGIEHARAVIEAYFSCKEPFYDGKTIRKLAFDLPRFVYLAARQVGASNQDGREIPYARGGDGLRDLTAPEE